MACGVAAFKMCTRLRLYLVGVATFRSHCVQTTCTWLRLDVNACTVVANVMKNCMVLSLMAGAMLHQDKHSSWGFSSSCMSHCSFRNAINDVWCVFFCRCAWSVCVSIGVYTWGTYFCTSAVFFSTRCNASPAVLTVMVGPALWGTLHIFSSWRPCRCRRSKTYGEGEGEVSGAKCACTFHDSSRAQKAQSALKETQTASCVA